MKQKHMNIDSRAQIAAGLNSGASFKSIATSLGKDCTTISKEVRKHLTLEQTGAYGKSFNNCIHAYNHTCKERHTCIRCTSMHKRLCWSCGKCIATCESYKEYKCKKLSKAPYVCNGCPERQKCTLEKALYQPHKAQEEYEELRTESRSGFALSENELSYLDSVVSPLLIRGQSLHHICTNNADKLMTCERTLYTYINNNLFSARNLDMPRKVRFRPRKVKSKILKVDRKCRIGRTYEDFKMYIQSNPDVPVRQLDSVEGIKGSAVLLTIHFTEQKFQLAYLRKSNDSQSVIDIFERLYHEIGPSVFMDIFPILLGDNGSEFSNPSAIEQDKQGNHRTKMFYCNPSAPYEKPNCENNHEFIRRIIPKGVDFAQYSQAQINLMMSHINSYARPILGDKSPYEVMAFQYGEELLKRFNIEKIPMNEIILKPELLR